MAQSNAAHEPSMEEILASIRRIIETTDGSEGDQAFESVEETRHAPEPQPESALDRVRENVANSQSPGFRQVGQGAAGQPFNSVPKSPTPPPASPVSAESDNSGSGTPRKPVSDAKEPASVSLAEVAARANSTAEAKYPAGGQASDRTKPQAERDDGQSAIMPDRTSTPDAKPQTPVAPPSDRLRPQALVSSEAGHRISTSFEHLNKAVTDGPRRSFDEIAEEMLRPMLQEWLEDNLPLLVERLVREEIERLARGAQRLLPSEVLSGPP